MGGFGIRPKSLSGEGGQATDHPVNPTFKCSKMGPWKKEEVLQNATKSCLAEKGNILRHRPSSPPVLIHGINRPSLEGLRNIGLRYFFRNMVRDNTYCYEIR